MKLNDRLLFPCPRVPSRLIPVLGLRPRGANDRTNLPVLG
jgi:hypothetical protein